ncbi:MAG TPA: ATP-binding protein, partial [Gammaproteobacteria bacterium]|nr:ATP-binding protein [Gammaproteobacteria bacterium]
MSAEEDAGGRRGPASQLGLLGLLAVLAVAGNWLHVSLLSGVDYLFGSVAVLLAAVWLGPWAAAAVAAVGGLYTVEVWGHPWALTIFVLEAVFVGTLRHHFRNLVLGDLAFWLLLGVPLVVALYLGVMGMGPAQAGLIALKQPVNGLFNALLANAVVLGFRLRRTPIPLPQVLFQVIFGSVLLLGMALITLQGYMVQKVQYQSMARQLEVVAADGGGDSATGIARLAADGTVAAERNLPDWVGRAEWRDLRPDLAILLPPPGLELPSMLRWKLGHFAHRVRDGADDEGRVVTRPARPVMERLTRVNLQSHGVLAAIALLGSLLALALARLFSRPFERLRQRVTDLPQRIGDGQTLTLPPTRFTELDQLAGAFGEMATSLNDSFSALERERQGLEVAVQRRTQELERFTEATAHHLQEPLRRVALVAQRLESRRRQVADEPLDPDVQRVVEEARHMADMLHGLQQYLGLNGRGLNREALALGEALERAWGELDAEVAAAEATLDLPEQSLPTVHGDAVLIHQLLTQLLANALRYGRAGVAPRVRVAAEENAELVRVAVCDNGRGIEPAYRERVFRMFERMRPWEDPPGSGAGLPLARKIT